MTSPDSPAQLHAHGPHSHGPQSHGAPSRGPDSHALGSHGHGSHRGERRNIVRTLVDNSFLLIFGAAVALVWANWAADAGSDSYESFTEFDVSRLWGGGGDGTDATHATDSTMASDSSPESHSPHSDGAATPGADAPGPEPAHGSHGLTLHFIVNDVLMALFFAIAAKEVWESLLPGGALSNPKKAATPLLATAGGILGPVVIYLGLAYLSGEEIFATFADGWAVPCATDIAFSYLVAKFIFGSSHPAIAFLLLLAIADDAAGLVILAIAYPQAPIEPAWLLATVAAVLGAIGLRKMKVHTHWAYLLGPGVVSWFSLYFAHIHPALGLVPIIPVLPHANTDLGLFAREEMGRNDTLNEFEHFWKLPVEYFLGLFGLVNAGVVFSSLGAGTWLVLAGLILGKPLGIVGMTFLAERGFGFEMPAGMSYRHVFVLGVIAAIGFTVALFVSVAAFTTPGAVRDSVKMGALLSFAAAPLAIGIARAIGIRSTDEIPAVAMPAGARTT